MSGQQKALLAALGVLLAVLFAVALGAGSGDRGDPSARNPLVELLGRVGGGRDTVDPATVDADCAQAPGRLVVTGRCALRVADPGGLRTLVLRSPDAFTVQAGAPGDADFTVTDEVTPADDGSGAEARIAVDRASTVLVSCPGDCLITVARD
ncbi:hypothetical protein SAMN05443287_104462 [Micromonospora phaseoli]|uniref:Uncharacterized protein n=1 Tax=Micromonospora phaseoli TaxID=1144548 RepID=A0A1H6Z608_9ACTN|nr:hypothetical protein [Micromonospora phaseoli]PZW00432.1 hypothetical protein CLV64_103461 [Micromonospora phaseoli]GIJ76911.1 hypothetical protein Xph01_13430 [Micromonospora phaseoli]SEJ44980.1 hypothetical protein SAMN05443287_104462 [Micromonospora phaseoli]